MRKFEFTVIRVTKEFYAYDMDKALSSETLQSIVKDSKQLEKHLVAKKELFSTVGHLSEVPALQRPRKNRA